MRIIPNLLDEVLNGTQSSSSAEKDDEFYSASSTEEQPKDDPKAVFTVQDTAPEEYEDSGMSLLQYTTLPSSLSHRHNNNNNNNNHNNNNHNNNNNNNVDNKANNNDYGKGDGGGESTIAEVEDFKPAEKDRTGEDDADNTLEWRNIMKRQALLENLHRNTIMANKRLVV